MALIAYKKVKKYRTMLLILLIISALGASYKILNISLKISYTLYADNNYNKKNIVVAEEYYSKSVKINSFSFKNSATALRMKELESITSLKSRIQALANNAKSAVELEDIDKLIEVHTSYKGIQKTADSKGEADILTSVVTYMDFEKDINRYFSEVIKWSERQGKSNIKKKDFSDEEFIQDLIKIPEEYLGSKENKQAGITETILEYEKSKLDAITSLRDMNKLTIEAEKILVQSKKMDIDSQWLFEKIDQCGKQIVEQDINDGNNDLFFKDAGMYQKFAKNKISNSESAVFELVSTKLSQDLKTANQFLVAKKFEKALELYTVIGKYSDTSKQVTQVVSAWAEVDPAMILNKVYKDTKFTNLTKGKNLWDATFYVIASSAVGNINKIYLGKITKDTAFTGVNAEVFKDGSKITGINVNKILDKGNPIIIAQGSSKTRKASYIGYEVNTNKLKEIFRFEADSANLDQAGVIIVTNPVGKGEGQLCYFEKADGVYKYTRDFITITADKITEYKNRKVRFKCEVVAINQAEKQAIGFYDGKYILMTGDIPASTGLKTVTGKFSNYQSVKKGEQQLTLPNVVVSSISN